jgi:hypothetical protein
VTHFSYPEEILTFNHEKMMAYYLSYAVWDIKNGTVLKLSDKKTVV